MGVCPDCGTELGSGGASAGLCPRCLLSLALERSPPEDDVDHEAATLDRPTTGQILGERYQMRELLGRGGMGEVWRARHRLLARPAAIKLIRPDVLDEETELARTAIRRFEREVGHVVADVKQKWFVGVL